MSEVVPYLPSLRGQGDGKTGYILRISMDGRRKVCLVSQWSYSYGLYIIYVCNGNLLGNPSHETRQSCIIVAPV